MKNTFDFDFKTGEFVTDSSGEPIVITGIDALKKWIEKILRTQINRYPIYRNTSYGANIEDLAIGKVYEASFAESELRREIEAALLQHEDIQSINDFAVIRSGGMLKITFTVLTVYGTEVIDYEY